MQIKDHRERMIRGRELVEQNSRKGSEERLEPASFVRSVEEHKEHKERDAEYESVIAYPLFQP